MIDHISIRVSDLEKSISFYTAALIPVGYTRLDGDFDGAIAFVPTDTNKKGSIWLIQSDTQEPLTRDVHISFAAPDTATVNRFYEAAMKAGGRDNGAPGKCPEYGETYYGGFVFDPDGNNIEGVTHIKI